MIRFTNICNEVVKQENYDYKFVIARSVRQGSLSEGFRQDAVLAPSWNLHNQTQEKVRGGTWTQQAFDEWYMPRFIKEMMDSKEAGKQLRQLVNADKQGMNILLECFCSNEQMCHRSIIAGFLQGVGCNVQTDIPGADYSKYLDIYKLFSKDSMAYDRYIAGFDGIEVLQQAVNNMHKDSVSSVKGSLSESAVEHVVVHDISSNGSQMGD